jgi:putative ATP-dependent endonuclease of OLD family
MSAPVIYHLCIERFRGIKALTWHPAKGVNLLLGGGDVGKTTILDAIALILSPVNTTSLSDAEYFARNVESGFCISAVLSLPPGSGIDDQVSPSWPWGWNGKDPVLPSIEDDGATGDEHVYCVRVRGTHDLELVYEILQPDGNPCPFSGALRRAIGLVRLSGDDRNDRDLRLVQGSALDRLLSDKGLRSRLASELADSGVKKQLKDDAKVALGKLDEIFKTERLPDKLDLAVIGSQGISIAALIGLTADREGVQLPLSSWGAGTRRISALAIAEQNQGDAPITIIDEIERGLEPYRQHALVTKLEAGNSQVFVTTHSPFAISAASKSSFWYVDYERAIGSLDAAKIKVHRGRDPETFLSFLTIVAEGKTECGFTTALLEKALAVSLKRYGVHVTDGGGHEATLELIEALAKGGVRFGVFADDEGGRHSERWKRVKVKIGDLLFRWTSGCLEPNVINALDDDKLEELLTDPADEKTGTRLRTLAFRLNIAEKDFTSIKSRAGAELRKFIIEAATGSVPEEKKLDKSEQKIFKNHAQDWFKTDEGGRELARKVFKLGAWPKLKPQLLPFCNAVRKAVALGEVQDLP